MIQRIQTIYMFMAVIIAAITFFVPLATFSAEGIQGFYELSGVCFGGVGIEPFNGLPKLSWGMLVFIVAYMLLILVAIFQFKRRMLQLKMIRWSHLMLFVYLLSYIAYCYAFACNSATDYHFSYGILFPLLAKLLDVLAAKAIRKDEDLVRAADRIR